MSKLNRREKTILRLMFLAVGIAVLMEGWDRYTAAKESLQSNIERMESEIATYSEKLKNESADRYREEATDIEEELEEARERVLELPKETDANLFMSQTISEQAEASGLTINSISNRKARVIDEEKGLSELRTYFGYDADLESLLRFFDAMDDQRYFVAIETLNISARRVPKRKIKRRKNSRVTRKPLNGNAVLTTVFLPNPDGNVDTYSKPVIRHERPDDVTDDEESDEQDANATVKGSDDDGKTKPELTEFKPMLPPTSSKPGGLTAVEPKQDANEKQRPAAKLQPKPRPLTDTNKPTKKKPRF